MRKRFTLLLILLLGFGSVRADEGMWLPNLIGKLKIKDMQAQGFQLTAKDLYDVNEGSLKDAIVRFSSGCTGELVSADGLLLTNHHCGYGQIQAYSSVENDYLTHGFWAMSREQELPNPGLKVSFLVRMDDVTKQVLRGVRPSMTEQQRSDKIAENSLAIEEKAAANTHYRASVEPFYYGNQYFLFVYEDFEDVRLVGAPPSSIGKFGGDTDNWMWPRHTGDFSIFRVYAGPDNKPAPYSPENVPYQPKRFLTVSTQGAAEGDFTFVYGFPGRTYEYITSEAVRYMVEKGNPHKINLRTIRLNIMSEEQEKSVQTRIQYAFKHARVANSWKKWQGEMKGLIRRNVIREKEEAELDFMAWAQNKKEYAHVLPELNALYRELEPYAFARDYVNETYGAIELVGLATTLITPDMTELDERQWNNLHNYVADFFKNYSPVIDRRTAIRMLQEYDRNVPEMFQPAILADYKNQYGSIEAAVDDLFDRTMFVSQDQIEELLKLDPEAINVAVKADPVAQLYQDFNRLYRSGILPEYNRINREITPLYRVYMKGMMEREKSRIFYPDANSTLRIAYGKVNGYAPMDAVYYEPYTSIEGIMEKDDPHVYDYDIPQSLRDLYAAKDYGRWKVNGSVPVCFIATNHTTGGNSGSPILNAKGELLGLNFDRTWESTMSDVRYDPEICRNISVDIRYVLFVIDKIGGAGYLLNEMRFAE
ncbi:MAG: S46 family peptidase [Rikenellaceae bacterium]|nr:S46 family peptidase [Rikenellaceae bacterium]